MKDLKRKNKEEKKKLNAAKILEGLFDAAPASDPFDEVYLSICNL